MNCLEVVVYRLDVGVNCLQVDVIRVEVVVNHLAVDMTRLEVKVKTLKSLSLKRDTDSSRTVRATSPI